MAKDINFTGYIGTYTKGESKGIYKFVMNSESGKIEEICLSAEIGNPTYLAISKDNKYLYSVAKVGEEGGVAAFSINKDSGGLKLINYKTEAGSPPCHVSLDRMNKYLFSANYHRGIAETYPIGKDGDVGDSYSRVVHEGYGPNNERQEKPHVHYAALTPDERYLCAIDLGIDKICVYNFEDGLLSAANELSVDLKPGTGPRHMDFHPNGRFAYIITELSSEIIALEYLPKERKFKVFQCISSLPKDFLYENLGSAIHITQDGKFLYASNRGHDSIAVFKIDSLSGKLTLVSHTSTMGKHPRDFEIDPTGNFLIAANMDSNNIVIFKIDKQSGMLEQTGEIAAVPSPVCIKFLNI